MFLIIPEALLTTTKFTGDEKILMAFLYNLRKADRGLFAGAEWIRGALGIKDPDTVLYNLDRKGVLEYGGNEVFLHSDAFNTINLYKPAQRRKTDGKSNFHKRDSTG